MDLHKILLELREEWEQESERRRLSELRIAQLERAIHSLEALALSATDTPAPSYEGSLTDACRSVLRASTQPLSAVQVRNEIRELGYDIAKHAQQMAAVHSSLKRLSESGEVAKVEAPDGVKFRWLGRAPGSPSALSASVYDSVFANVAMAQDVLDSLNPSALKEVLDQAAKVPAIDRDVTTAFEQMMKEHLERKPK